jgi:outer membrane protein assembly factor BamB
MGPNMQGPEALLGHEIAGYTLSRVVGRGLSGAVFLGERDDAQVAIKVLLPALTLTPDELAAFRQRFEREAATIRTLTHPHILPVLESGEDTATGLSFMVMPYMPNGTLADQVALRGPLPLAECTRLIAQLASALDYAHSLGVVHRDIKPANVLLDADGNAVLADFGIVKLFDAPRTTLTTTGQVIGTPEFMAPEQARGEAIGPAADIYSLGALLYYLVTGHPPFQGSSVVEVLLRLVQGVPVSPQQLRTDLPTPAAAAIMAALAKTPEQRFATATQLAEAFDLGVQGQWVALPGIPFAAEQMPSDAVTQQYVQEQPVFTPTPPPLYGAVSPNGMTPPYGYPAPSGPLFDGAPLLVPPSRRGSTIPASGIFGGIILTAAIVVLIAALFHFPPFGKGNAGNNGSTSMTFANATATPTSPSAPIVAGSPTASPVPGASPTPTIQPTATLATQPTNTPTISATDTPTLLPTDTPTPVPTDTPTPSLSPQSAVYFGGGSTIAAVRVSDGSLIWKTAIPTDYDRSSDAPALNNGVIYAGVGNYIVALNANSGAIIWKSQLGGHVISIGPPAVGSGIVSIGTNDNNIYALNEGDGSLRWQYPTGGWDTAESASSPTIVAGVVYIGSNGNSVLALDAGSGSVIWHATVSSGVLSMLRVADGMVFVSGTGSIVALNAANGAQIWQYYTSASMENTAAVGDGLVIAGGLESSKLYALNESTGTLQWTASISCWQPSPVVQDGTVYVANNDMVEGLNNVNGAVEWSVRLSSEYEDTASPTVLNQIVYTGGNTALYAILDGGITWQSTVLTPASSPVIGP